MTDEERREKAREACRRWRANNPDKAKAAVKRCFARYKEQGIDPNKRYKRDQRQMWASKVKTRAIQAGLDFDLGKEELLKMLEPMVCERTGLPLSFKGEEGKDRKRVHPWAPSLDRIDSSRGYVRGNVQVVCWAYNVAKNQWADHVVLTMASALIERTYS